MIDQEALLLALRARLLGATGLPALRGWDGEEVKRVTGQPYLEEDFVPATTRRLSAPQERAWIEERGLYVIRYYGVTRLGNEAIRAVAAAILARFRIGLPIGDQEAWIPGNPGPTANQIRPTGDGWSLVTITVPWNARSVNTP